MANGTGNGTSYKVTKTNDGWLVKEDKGRTGGGGPPLSPAAVRIIIILFAVVLIIAAIFGVADIIKDRKKENDMRYSVDKFEITILDKIEAAEESKYQDGYVTAFEINVKNNDSLLVLSIEGDLTIYNSSGEELDTSSCTFSCNLGEDEEKSFILNLDREYSEVASELYYADLEDLSATFKLTRVVYEGYVTKEYSEDPVTILELGEDSDGVSTTEKAYQRALYLFRQRKYSEAIPMLEELGEYKNSAEIIEEIVTTVETQAEKLASSGDYKGAFEVLADIGYDTENNDISQAYLYASEGNFADAVNYGLSVICIPEGTKIIPEDFLSGANCSALKKVILPSTIKTIGNAAFMGCTQLTEINFPDGLVTIGESAFNNSGLKELKLPNTLQTIGDKAFANSELLESVELPTSVIALGEYAFHGCTGLTSISIPGNIKTINNNAFAYCNSLTEVSISEGVEIIGESAFECCSSLTTVVLPDSLKEIGRYSFSNCATLTEITIPRNVINIKSGAFNVCYNLEKITFENTTGWLQNSAVSVNVDDPQKNARDGYSGNSWQRTE